MPPLTFRRAELPSKECVVGSNKASGTERGGRGAPNIRPKKDAESGPLLVGDGHSCRVQPVSHSCLEAKSSLLFVDSSYSAILVYDRSVYDRYTELRRRDPRVRSLRVRSIYRASTARSSYTIAPCTIDIPSFDGAIHVYDRSVHDQYSKLQRRVPRLRSLRIQTICRASTARSSNTIAP